MRECRCGICPGYYLVGHMCTCSCHKKKAEEAPEDPMDVSEPLESEIEASERERREREA